MMIKSGKMGLSAGHVECSDYLGSIITKDARYIRKIESRIFTAKAALSKEKALSTSKSYLNVGRKILKYCVWILASYFAEKCRSSLRKADQKYFESFEMWCWRRMEKISWTDRERNDEMLHRDKEERNVLNTVKRRKANWIGQILRDI
jgi:hypothetical protein